MDLLAALKAATLGILEGFTEYLPVSSTGHLLLAEHFLGLNFADPTFDKTFTVLVQLGSILALLSVYFGKLLRIALEIPHDPRARNFVIGVLVAFLPAALVGAVLIGFIKSVLFNPMVVCVALIAGGIVLLVVDDLPARTEHRDATGFPLGMCLKIGLFQCLAMIPGVSRSGATIVGAMLMGADKRAAAEFSFFLAVPTMVGAFTLDLAKNYKTLTSANLSLIGIGFVFAFISGLLVVKGLLTFVSKRGFATFAWWRILVGSAGLAGLWVFG
jgi:undecaprenyl-diphosphatase